VDTRLVILVAASALLALAIVYFIGSLLGAGRARRLAASAPHTVPLPMPDAAQIALTPLAPADTRFPDPPLPLATTAVSVTLDEPEAFVAIQEPAWAAPEPAAPEPVAWVDQEPAAPEPVAWAAPEPVAPEPVAVEASEPIEPPAPLPAWREVGTAASIPPDPVAPPETPVPVWELEPPPAQTPIVSAAAHAAPDVLADLRMLSVQAERPTAVVHQPPEPSAPSDEPPPPAPLAGAQPTTSPPTYAMVAPVELMFTDGPKRIGIRPGTATFLKYQRLAAVLLADLRKARAGGS
jgi:DNA polymerase-3 subunit gamma/tau